MDWQPDATYGAGEEPGRGSALPGPGSAPASPDRDHELAGFAAGGEWDACPLSAALKGRAWAEAVSGQEWRCPGATDDELTGVLRRWAAIEAWAAAGGSA